MSLGAVKAHVEFACVIDCQTRCLGAAREDGRNVGRAVAQHSSTVCECARSSKCLSNFRVGSQGLRHLLTPRESCSQVVDASTVYALAVSDVHYVKGTVQPTHALGSDGPDSCSGFPTNRGIFSPMSRRCLLILPVFRCKDAGWDVGLCTWVSKNSCFSLPTKPNLEPRSGGLFSSARTMPVDIAAIKTRLPW